MDIKQIFWIAGFLEGEGCFSSTRSTSHVTATQVQKEPLEKLHKFLGGSLCVFSRSAVNGNFYYR